MDENVNPLFIYDGRRMRTLGERKFTDYASPVIFTNKNPEKGTPLITASITKNLQHIAVNKVRSQVHTLAFTTDGRRLVTGSASGELTLWNSFGFNFETILQAHDSCVRTLKWCNNLLISGDANGNLKFWDNSMTNNAEIRAFNESARDVSFSPTGRKFTACGDSGEVKVFDTITACEEFQLKGHLWDVRQAKWHVSKALIASGGKDTSIKLWDPRKGLIHTSHTHKNTVFALNWSSCGNFLMSAGRDQTLRLTDLRTMKVFAHKAQNSDITAIVEHPFSKLITTASAIGKLTFYEKFVSEPLDCLDKAHDHVVWCAEYHPIGHVLATGSLDQSVRFWTRKGENRPIDRNHPVLPISRYDSGVDDTNSIPGLQL